MEAFILADFAIMILIDHLKEFIQEIIWYMLLLTLKKAFHSFFELESIEEATGVLVKEAEQKIEHIFLLLLWGLRFVFFELFPQIIEFLARNFSILVLVHIVEKQTLKLFTFYLTFTYHLNKDVSFLPLEITILVHIKLSPVLFKLDIVLLVHTFRLIKLL